MELYLSGYKDNKHQYYLMVSLYHNVHENIRTHAQITLIMEHK